MPDILSLIVNSAGLVLQGFEDDGGGNQFLNFAINDLAIFAVLAPVIAYLWRDMKNRDERHNRELREMRAEHKTDYERLRSQHNDEISHLRTQYQTDLAELNAKLLESERARSLATGQNEQMAKRIEEQAAHILRLETRMERVEQNGHAQPTPTSRSRSRAKKTT